MTGTFRTTIESKLINKSKIIGDISREPKFGKKRLILFNIGSVSR